MIRATAQHVTAFDGVRRLAAGPLAEVWLAAQGAAGPVLIFNDATGRVVDLTPHAPLAAEPDAPRGPGRPKLGVVAREVTLLPRHWDWLNSQPGGASVALRKLVEQARRSSGDSDRRRAAQEAAYRFMTTMAGNLPGYEEALRSLFADDRRAFAGHIAAWPADVRDHAIQLAFADLADEPNS